MSDVRRSLRALIRKPGFTIVVLATLTLGIGAATTIFSVVWGVLLAPLPYDQPEEIMTLNEQLGDRPISLSYSNLQDWKKAQRSFEAIAATLAGGLNLETPEGAEPHSALFVDPEYFEIFDVPTAVGRVFGADENLAPGAHPVVVLSYGIWQRRFAGDPAIVGSTIPLSGLPYTVLGVVSEDHRQPFGGTTGQGSDLFIPAMMAGQADPRGDGILSVRRWRVFGAVGRLAPGVSQAMAQADLEAVASVLAEDYPAENRGIGASVRSLAETNTQALRLPVLLLMIGALFLLFIACLNVANLLLVRGAGRQHELSVQLALGAGRRRLLRLLLVESGALALAGGVLGVVLAAMSLPAVIAMVPAQLPATAEVGINLPVLLGALAITLVAGITFGLVPAVRVSGADLRGPLSGVGRVVSDRFGDRFRSGLVLFELATATMLLASATFMIGVFEDIQNSDPGFATENILTIPTSFSPTTYPDLESLGRGAAALMEALESAQGVEWAEVWGPGRPGLGLAFQSSVPEGMQPAQINESPLGRRHHVLPGALANMGIQLLQGRDLTNSDDLSSRPVAVISQSMASELWPDEDPIGKYFHSFQAPGTPIPPEQNWEVVGVVADAQHSGRVPPPGAIDTRNDVYFSFLQRPERGVTLLVHTAGEPTLAPVREAMRQFDPGLPIFPPATVAENFRQEEASARFATRLMSGFGLTALLLSALGVYGVISFTVSQRRREIGLRAALGATSDVTVRRFVGHGTRLAVGGVAAGGALVFGLFRMAAGAVPGLPVMGLGAVGLASGLLVGVAGLACLIPSWRATRVEPVVALRND